MKSLAVILFGVATALCQTPVTGTLKLPTGEMPSGTCTFQANAGPFQAPGTVSVIPQPVVVKFTRGILSVALAPTDTGTPPSQFYTITCKAVATIWPDGHQTPDWTWGPLIITVPTSSSPVDISNIMIPTPPQINVMIPLSNISGSGATTGQNPCWNGSSWVPGNCPGGLQKFYAALTSTSTVYPATVHGLGLYPTISDCYKSDGTSFEFGGYQSDPITGDVTITVLTVPTGAFCTLIGSPTGSGRYTATVTTLTTTVLFTTHHVTSPTVGGCFDSTGNLYDAGSVTLDSFGTITISNSILKTGKCIIQ